jgi:transcription antitermination factor NusG
MMELNSDANNPGAGEWSAVYTRHQHEKAVAANLSRNRFDVFLPLYNVVRQWKDRKKRLSLPLFPGYVFLRGGPERRVHILSTPGVHSIVTIGGKPAPIPAIEIDAIRRAVESHLEVEPHPFLRVGDRVRIKSGPLTGIEGILVRRKSAYRLILSAELLERSIAVEVDAFSVDPLPYRIEAPPLASIRTRPFMYYRAAG